MAESRAGTLKRVFTFGELARMALGETTLNNRHLNILYVLLSCLLRKLDCADDIITINGGVYQCLCRVLAQCDEPLLDYNYKNEKSLRLRGELLDKLELRTQQISQRFEKHLEQVDECNRISDYPNLKWRRYRQLNENTTSFEYKDNVVWCFLNHNYFLFRMRSLLTKPMLMRIDKLEEIIKAALERIEILNQRSDAFDGIMAVLPVVFSKKSELRVKITENFVQFETAVVEIQQMMNCKLDRLHMPTIKQYVRVISDHILHQLHVMHKKQPIAEKAIKLGRSTCLSCSKTTPVTSHHHRHHHYDELSELYRELVSPLNRKILANYEKCKSKRRCKCKRGHPEPTLLEKMNQFQIKSFPLVRANELNDFTAHTVRRFSNTHRYYLNEKGSMKSLLSNMTALVMESDKFKAIVSIRIDKPLLYRRKSLNVRGSALSVYSFKSNR